MMKPSGRMIVGADGKRVAVMYDPAKTDNDAHSYDAALDAGRRFKLRQALAPAQRDALSSLQSDEQNAVLDMAAPARAVRLNELCEAARHAKAEAAAAASGIHNEGDGA